MTTGDSAEECFVSSELFDFDYTFMDVMMPAMDGLEAARAIRAMSRPDAGMNTHLTKPLEIEKLCKALEQTEKIRIPRLTARWGRLSMCCGHSAKIYWNVVLS